MRFSKGKVVVCLFSLGWACLVGSLAAAAEGELDEDTFQLITQFVTDADRETRAVGLQYVREEMPGEAATKRFAALLADLALDGQVDLLEALGDRGDAAALPGVMDMLKSPEEAVRAAALRALGDLGTTADVALLTQSAAAAGSDREKAAARQSLIRLRGDQVNSTIVSAMAESEPQVRVELLGVLAARNAKEALPVVLESAGDSEASVRLAALGALRFLADESHAAAIVKTLKATGGDAERGKAELALLAVCSRGRQECADAIIARLADADVPSRIALLRALGRAGGEKALGEIVARLTDEDETVRHQAVRMLSIWPDPAAVDHLLEIARTAEDLRHQVLAIRGLVRLARPQKDKPADLKTLTEAMNLAKRPEEKRRVLGALGGAGTPESLALATPLLEDPTLAEEAGLAAVVIAEKMEGGSTDAIRAAMDKVLKRAKNRQTRDRAQKLLKSL